MERELGPEDREREEEPTMREPKGDTWKSIALVLVGLVIGLATQWVAFIKDAASEEYVEKKLETHEKVDDSRWDLLRVDVKRIEDQANEGRKEIKAMIIELNNKVSR